MDKLLLDSELGHPRCARQTKWVLKSITQLMFLLDVYCRSKRLRVSAGIGRHQVFVIRCFLRVLYIIMWWRV